jgi:hypothetical protein
VDVKAILASKRQEILDLEERTREAGRLEADISAMRRERAQLEARRMRFESVGTARLELPFKAVIPGAGEVQMEALRSAQTGVELAVETEERLAHLDGELERLEAELAKLLK